MENTSQTMETEEVLCCFITFEKGKDKAICQDSLFIEMLKSKRLLEKADFNLNLRGLSLSLAEGR
jgi:hypothetical protein